MKDLIIQTLYFLFKKTLLKYHPIKLYNNNVISIKIYIVYVEEKKSFHCTFAKCNFHL